MFEFDRMFSNIVAIRQYVQASSSRVFGGKDVGDDGTSNANIAENDLEEENDDSEEDNIPNFMNDISKMVGGVNMPSNSNTKSSGKKK